MLCSAQHVTDGHIRTPERATNNDTLFVLFFCFKFRERFIHYKCNVALFCQQVHIVSRFIMNGVCVRWRGSIDLEKLEGIGCLELDEERAAIEDAALRDQIERYNQRLRDFEDKQRAYREHGEELRAHSHVHAQRFHQSRQPPHGANPTHPHAAHPVHIKPHSQGALIS